MAENTGVFGFEYLEDAELEQSDVVGCASALRLPNRPLICDIRRLPMPGPIVVDPIDPVGPVFNPGF